MPSNFTENYQLNQWDAEDRVLRTDFNEDNAKVDAALTALSGRVDAKADSTALAALSAVVTEELIKDRTIYGSFEGNKVSGRVIQLPWEPKLVFMIGKTTSYRCIAVVTQDVSYINLGTSFDITANNPVLNGSQITLTTWLNDGPTYYIAIR